MLNRELLVRKMKDYGDSQQSLAEALGYTDRTAVCLRMPKTEHTRRRYEFDRADIECMIQRYHLTAAEVLDIFFSDGANIDA